MRKLPKVLLAMWIVTLYGCSSAPVNYHTLLPAQPTARPAGVNVEIEKVIMPPQVDRPQLVVRQGSSGLAILETEWWGANLVDEFRNALEDQLGAPTGGSPRSALRVDVQRFDSVPGRYALLDVTWRLRRPGAQGALTCQNTLQSPADNSIAGLVTAHQRNMHSFAQLVAQSANQGATHCPASARQ